MKKNSFEKMCDELEKNYNENEITYVRKYVEREIGDDIDLLMKIQAEAEEDDFWQYNTIRVSILAMIFSGIGVIIQLVPITDNNLTNFVVRLIYLAMIIFILIKIGYSNRFESVRKWRKYVLIVIQNRIRDLEK